jgi:hypothetical protein
VDRLPLENCGQEENVRDDKKTKKSMIVGFVLICICCAFMHRILVTKGNLYIQRSKPRYNLEKKDVLGDMKEGVGTVEGLVSAVSYDKFFLELPDGNTQTFLRGEVSLPEVGGRARVTYAGGEPPKALMIEEAKKRPAAPPSAPRPKNS